MKLTQSQESEYRERGYLVLDKCFTEEEIELIRNEVDKLIAKQPPGTVMEEDGVTVRGLHGCHMHSKLLKAVTCQARLLEPARQVIESEVYVHQYKINIKAAFGGDVWPWHQDFIFWNKGDGMKEARAMNVCVFIDDVTEFNGPLIFIPGSHKEGMIDVPPRSDVDKSNPWVANLTARLKYTLDRETVEALVEEGGLVAPKGPAGTVMLFDSNIVHASVANISPYSRMLLILTYNSVENKLLQVDEPRPEFLASHEYSALKPENEPLASFALT